LKEIRIHGRGGQGAVTLAELVCHAAIDEGKYAQSMPSFGPERRGAPVLAFLRISDEHIKIRAEVITPDVVVVLDPGLLNIADVTSGLKTGGTVLINTKKSIDDIRSKFGVESRLGVVNATKIAKDTLGVPITNTTMIGALLKATKIVKKDSLIEPLKHRFGPMADKNINAMNKAFDETLMEGA